MNAPVIANSENFWDLEIKIFSVNTAYPWNGFSSQAPNARIEIVEVEASEAARDINLTITKAGEWLGKNREHRIFVIERDGRQEVKAGRIYLQRWRFRCEELVEERLRQKFPLGASEAERAIIEAECKYIALAELEIFNSSNNPCYTPFMQNRAIAAWASNPEGCKAIVERIQNRGF